MPHVDRAPSIELGEGDFAVTYNKNGRPVRKSAGHRLSPNIGYVDSKAIDDEVPDMLSGDESASSSDFDSEAERERLKPRSRKRKRTPSPSPPPLSPLPPPDLPSEDELSSIDLAASNSEGEAEIPGETDHAEPIHLTFNIPPGFSGPLEVKLDLRRGRGQQSKKARVEASPAIVPAPPMKKKTPKSKPGNENKKGFLSLPAELRIEIYNMVFQLPDKKKIDFVEATNTCRSGQFLRTCKQVEAEGTSILYGDNTFYFGRTKEMRRPYWTQARKEIGYKDLRRFLTDIGPKNVNNLRNLWLCFDDAAPSSVPHIKRSEDRRYVHDPHLIESIKVLAKYAELEKLTCTFWGRRNLSTADTRFLEHLTKLKADELEIRNPTSNEDYRYVPYQSNKLHDDAKQMIKRDVVRKTKMYTK